jgi:hypothetical protein
VGHRNKVTHSEDWWEMLAPPTVLRCEGHYKSGERCRREAILGGNVCRQHGGAAPQVRQLAAARIANHADAMAALLIEWANDPNVEVRDRAKIAQDLLDRADVAGTSKVLVGVGEIDPVERLFRDLLSDPAALAPAQPAQQVSDPQIEKWNREAMEDVDIVDAEIVEDDEPDHIVPSDESMTTKPPPHIRRDLERLGLL